MRRTAAALVLLLCALLAPAARAQNEKLTVADVSPLDSFLVLTVPDWPGARAALLRSELGKLWNEPDVQAFLDEFMKETAEDRESGAGEVWAWLEKNVRLEDLREPTGGVGVAMFPEPKGPNGADPADATGDVHILAFGDFGDGAEGMMTTLADILERLRKDGHIKLEDSDYEGTDIYIVTVVPSEDEDQPGDDMDDEDGEDAPPKPVMIARSGPGIIASTSRRALEAAIDRAAGKGGRAERLADNRTYAAALAQHPAGSHALFVGIASDYIRGQVREGLTHALSAFAPPGGADAVMAALGLGAVEAVGIGMRLDTETGTAEQSLGMLAPRKEGLLTLVDSRLDAFAPPVFAPADAMNLYSLGLRFDRIPDVVRSVLKALPPEMQQQAGAMQAGFEAQVAPILAALAPEFHVVQTVARPFDAGGEQSLVAIRLKDPLVIANFLNQLAPMAQMTPRVFEGNQIFQREEAGDESPAVGIGFDHVFFGPPQAIENAMRLASRPEAPRLSAAERFRRAAGILGEGAAFYSYTNTAETIEFAYWRAQNAEKLYEAQIAEWGLDEEMRKEFLDSFREEQPDWLQKLPPVGTILRHVGDTVTEVRPTPDGFRGRTIFLRP